MIEIRVRAKVWRGPPGFIGRNVWRVSFVAAETGWPLKVPTLSFDTWEQALDYAGRILKNSNRPEVTTS